MAYDEDFAARIRAGFEGVWGCTEKKMFGGLAFLLNGNMCCGTHGPNLIVRVGPDAYEEALAQPHVDEMRFTGRPMRGWIEVDAQGIESDAELQAWIDRGIAFAGALPKKAPKARKARGRKPARKKKPKQS